jgi:NAD(P)-dependent dehydrogenase (short-subunit alcohol dehydrogenase family)
MTEPATHNVLSGSDAVLVQGASRGIGLALVRRLLEHSEVGRVFATCRNPQAAEDLATLAEEYRLALVINCAGVLHEPGGMQPERRLADVKVESFVQSVRVNALGPLLMAKHFEPLLRSAQRTVFASISARVGSIGDNRLGGWYAYRASKAAQNMATRNLSIELRRRARGIICVALHPGTVDTGLSEPFQSRVPSNKLFTPAQAAENLLAVVDSLDPDSNGKFYAWDGSEIPW